MPTPSIQTLRADAQQVLNLDSISAVRSVVAATLANANAGTPLNPNLTTQQLWNQFYQIVTQPKSDIESIIANQLMKFMYAPPAPGGAGANHEVIYNNNGVLAGDPKFLWDDALNKLDIDGSATIDGDLTVDTSTLKVDSTNNRVGIGTASPGYLLDVQAATAVANILSTTGTNTAYLQISNTGGIFYLGRENSAGTSFASPAYSAVLYAGGAYPLVTTVNGGERYRIASDGVATWSNVGGVAGTAMTLDSTGLGVGASPNAKLTVYGGGATTSTVNFSGGSAGTDNATIASNYNLHFQVDANNTIGGREFVWRYGGKGYSDGTLFMKLDASGNLSLANGNLVMSTSGKGIDFSATASGSGTMTSELLNDYEEGTFVPTVIGSTAAGVGTYTQQGGYYTKVGNLVTVSVFLGWTAHTGTGDMRFGNLPFTTNSASDSYGAASITFVNNIALSASNVLTLLIPPGQIYIEAYQYPVGGGSTTGVTMDTSGSIMYTATYRV